MTLRLWLPAVLVGGLASGLTACAQPAAKQAGPFSGVWVSEGYGNVFEVVGDTIRSFQVTKISCIPSAKATAVTPPAGALGAFRMTEAPITLVILPDSAADRARIHMNGAASDMIVRRVVSKTTVCNQPTPDTPPSNFEVFAETWAEHYPFFERKGADWPAIVAANRAKVTDRTTPEQLFAILQGMIAPFEDAHTGIIARSMDQRFSGGRRAASWVDWAERGKAEALLLEHLSGPLRSFCEGQLQFGILGPDVGYLRVKGFGRYHPDGTFESGLVALEAALDSIFAAASGWKGFVIDVRINGGGADPYGLAIAARLTDREYVAYAKQARSDPADPSRWTAEQPSLVRPTARPGFKGKVVELIGIQSVSAAETFTQALLNREPKVIRVGESTQGVFSDVLGRSLPNGWLFGLPNERFVTGGKSYDGPGIPADIAVLSFTPAGLKSGRDAGIEKALELIRNP